MPIPSSPGRSLVSRSLVRAAVSALLVVTLAACTSPAPRGSNPPERAPVVREGAATDRLTSSPDPAARARRGLRLLSVWDARRSEAFAGRDRAALAELYTPGAGLLAQDLALLRAYDRRGLRVVDLTTQVREVVVLASGRNRVRLRVSERLAGVRFRTADDRYRRVPGSAYATRVLTLQRGGPGWRISSVTPG